MSEIERVPLVGGKGQEGDVRIPSRHKAKDRDGLYKRRAYWHYALVIAGKRRSFSTETKDYEGQRTC